MSLSDYSSDDSLDEEPAVGVEVLKSVARSARTGSPSSMDSSSKSMATAALAGLAMAGIAAGAMLLRKYFLTDAPMRRKDQPRDRSEPDAENKKELRRKRPVGGDVKGSPRETAPFMARTESTSSVGPLRKHPRRDTSEDSEGGEVSGASPKSGGTTDGHSRPLRKTPSTNGRHRRPPRRGAMPRGTSPAGTGSESEGNRALPASSAKRESAPEASTIAPVIAQGAGAEPAASGKPAPQERAAALGSKSAAADSPALLSTAAGAEGDDKAAPGKAGAVSESASAAADGKVAPEKSGPAAPTDLMAKYRGVQPPQPALPEQEASKESADAGGRAAPEKGVAVAPTHLGAEHRDAQPAAQQESSKGSAVANSKAAPERAAPVAESSKEPEHAGAKVAPETAVPGEKSSDKPAGSSRKLPQNESFPDLVAPKIKPAASLDTFTAEMDVLDQEVESAATSRSHGGDKHGAKSTAPADVKPDSRAAGEAKKADLSNAAGKAGSKADAAEGAAGKPAADQGAAFKGADKGLKGSGAESGKMSAETTVDKDKAGSIDAGEEGTPAGDLVAAAQAEIDKQDDLPAAKELVSPAVAESKSPALKADAAAPAGSSTSAKKPSGTVDAGPARSAEGGGSSESPVSGKVAAAVAGVGGAAAAAGAAAGGTDREASRALSSEPSLLPDARAAAAGDDAGGASEEALDLSSVEVDAVGRAVRDAAEGPAGGDASAAAQKTSGEQHSGSTGKEGETPEQNAGSDAPAKKDPEAGACDTAAGTPPVGQDAAREAAKHSEEPVAEHGATSSTEGKILEGEDAPDKALAAGEPSKVGGDAKASQETLGSKEAEASEAPVKAAAYDPLGMEAAEEESTEAQASAEKKAGNGHLQQGDGQATIEPQNQAESNVELNLAVALRIISEKGNLAAAERTLHKSLAAVKAGDGGQVRPQFRCRLAGTLADIIARSEQTAGLVAGKPNKDSASRSAEIVDLLRYGYEAALETGDGSLRARESWRLGAALAEAEDFEAAHALFQGELAHWEKQCGPADPRTQHSRTWLADILVKLGRKEEAYKLLTGAAQDLEMAAQHASSSKPEEQAGKHARATDDSDVPGHDLSPTEAASVTAAKCYVHLANIQAGEEEWDTAVGNARKAVTIMEAAFGEANPRTSTAYGTLASILKHQKKEEGLREALGLYEKLQRIAETVHGLRNSHIAMAHRAIADVHMMLNEHGQAASHTEKAVQIAGAVHGRDHPIMESYWQAVAEAKQAAGDKEGAKDANRQALRVRSHAQRGGGGGRGPRAGGSLGGGRRGGRGRGRR